MNKAFLCLIKKIIILDVLFVLLKYCIMQNTFQNKIERYDEFIISREITSLAYKLASLKGKPRGKHFIVDFSKLVLHDLNRAVGRTNLVTEFLCGIPFSRIRSSFSFLNSCRTAISGDRYKN